MLPVSACGKDIEIVAIASFESLAVIRAAAIILFTLGFCKRVSVLNSSLLYLQVLIGKNCFKKNKRKYWFQTDLLGLTFTVCTPNNRLVLNCLCIAWFPLDKLPALLEE